MRLHIEHLADRKIAAPRHLFAGRRVQDTEQKEVKMKFRKKPVVIEALQLRWDTWSEMCDFVHVGKLSDGKPEGKQDGEKIQLQIPTLEGVMTANEGDWIIRGIAGELYPIKDCIFLKTYERVLD